MLFVSLLKIVLFHLDFEILVIVIFIYNFDYFAAFQDLQDRVTRKLDSDVELKARLKEIFVEELTRRMDFSGTFEITQGTVKKLVKYPGDDPVTVFYQSEREEDLTGKAWDREADCEYLRKSMRGMGKFGMPLHR